MFNGLNECLFRKLINCESNARITIDSDIMNLDESLPVDHRITKKFPLKTNVQKVIKKIDKLLKSIFYWSWKIKLFRNNTEVVT
nr:hypothetical protein [Mycoplasmopsis bovis]QQH18751.1 hypothetical protein HYE49_00900 [Mycoplasmopsis bovis]